jgi:hypothetical protein
MTYVQKGSAALLLAGLLTAGCQQLPGDERGQGAVIGGVGGAAAGAAIGGERHRVLGALLGGAAGAAGGYVVGAHVDRVRGGDQEAAVAAARRAETRPVTVEEALAATTADINQDGFVTLDEVIAMQRAGLSDQEMIQRLRATGQIFELSPEQQRQLANAGVSQNVINQMETINQDARQQILGGAGGTQPVGRIP